VKPGFFLFAGGVLKKNDEYGKPIDAGAYIKDLFRDYRNLAIDPGKRYIWEYYTQIDLDL
jgi:hypothetical protein